MTDADEPYEPKRARLGSTARDEHGNDDYQPDADRPDSLGASGGASNLAGASSGGIRQSTRPKRPPSLPLKVAVYIALYMQLTIKLIFRGPQFAVLSHRSGAACTHGDGTLSRNACRILPSVIHCTEKACLSVLELPV